MSNNKKPKFTEDSESVRAHLSITQAIIQRMAANSSASKAWCITIVSALLVIIADKGKPQFAWLAFIPVGLFLVLDIYYLALEKGFRESYNLFIAKLHEGSILTEDLYALKPSGRMHCLVGEAIISFSIWPFYLSLITLTYFAKITVLSPNYAGLLST